MEPGWETVMVGVPFGGLLLGGGEDGDWRGVGLDAAD